MMGWGSADGGAKRVAGLGVGERRSSDREQERKGEPGVSLIHILNGWTRGQASPIFRWLGSSVKMFLGPVSSPTSTSLPCCLCTLPSTHKHTYSAPLLPTALPFTWRHPVASSRPHKPEARGPLAWLALARSTHSSPYRLRRHMDTRRRWTRSDIRRFAKKQVIAGRIHDRGSVQVAVAVLEGTLLRGDLF